MSNNKIHYFSPTNKSWKQKLTAIETFHCGMYPKGSFYFDNGIDINQLIYAMQTTLDAFDFLFCRLHSHKDAVVAAYLQDNTHTVQLEIEELNTALNNIDPFQTLQQKVDNRILTGVTDNIENLPMVAFKLTNASNGFVLGYCINHTFIDQASLFYFFKYIAKSYSGNSHDLKSPIITDIETLLNSDEPMYFADLAAFRNYATSVGLKYIPNLIDLFEKNKTDSTHKVYLHLDTMKMNQLKQQANDMISKNDIMHALLLKIYAETSTLPIDSNMHFGFACNMRKYFGLGEEAIGNILHFPYFDPLKVCDVRASDIISLAKISRTNIKNISVASYQQKILWFKQFYAFHEIATNYVPLPYVDPSYWSHTNWGFI